jgi:pyruvate/2-oxoglutarate dehydrogenase complex dihydrolipoamide acyltransferase (E2) component
VNPTRNPIRIPELQLGDQELEVGVWLVEEGQSIEAGDRIVELLFPGVVFIVSSEVSGILVRRERLEGVSVRSGDLLGWVESDAAEPQDEGAAAE